MQAFRGILFIIFIIAVAFPASAQYHSSSKKAKKYFEEAMDSYHNARESEALDNLHKAVKADEDFIEAWMLLAQIHKDRGDYNAAISEFERALLIDPEYYPEGYMILSRVEFSIGKYDKALTSVERFLELGKFGKITGQEAEALRDRCKFAIRATGNPVPFDPVNLGDSINSVQNEYWPSLSIDESTLYLLFSIRRIRQNPLVSGICRKIFTIR